MKIKKNKRIKREEREKINPIKDTIITKDTPIANLLRQPREALHKSRMIKPGLGTEMAVNSSIIRLTKDY